jgi:CheY-like chemotaxis protein/hemerythrin-like domain-containing protein
MKILVAEDDDVSRYLLEKILASESHAVVSTSDGEECLEAYKNGNFDMVITDWMMPKMDGIDLTKKIVQLREKTGAYSYILMVTAKTQTDDMLDALMAGVDDFLAKPYNKETLVSRIQIGKKILAQMREEITVKDNPAIRQLLADHETLRSMARILTFVRDNIEDDLPKDLLKWCSSTALLLTLDVHVARENLYIAKFLENLMDEQGDWFKELANSSLVQLQDEHERMEGQLTEFQGCLEVYLQRRGEMLADVTDRIQAIGRGIKAKDDDKGLGGAVREINKLKNDYFARKKEALVPVRELLKSYVSLMRAHHEKEEELFFPFTQKYLTNEDLRQLKREFDAVVDGIGRPRVESEVEKVEKLTAMIMKMPKAGKA